MWPSVSQGFTGPEVDSVVWWWFAIVRPAMDIAHDIEVLEGVQLDSWLEAHEQVTQIDHHFFFSLALSFLCFEFGHDVIVVTCDHIAVAFVAEQSLQHLAGQWIVADDQDLLVVHDQAFSSSLKPMWLVMAMMTSSAITAS